MSMLITIETPVPVESLEYSEDLLRVATELNAHTIVSRYNYIQGVYTCMLYNVELLMSVVLLSLL